MKVAIVVPHPVPFAIGGAENLWWGLQRHIAGETGHDCDIVGLISPEATLPEIVASYRMFAELDLSAYDRVISTKYPAWMVDHPNHVCYLQHRLRGLYDTYSGPALDEGALPPAVLALHRWMRGFAETAYRIDKAALAEFFDRFDDLVRSGQAGDALAFPGPFARAVVRFMDDAALRPGRIRRFAAISANVARRKDYFPPGVAVEIVPHPPHRDDYRCGAADTLFTSSRLDGPKRVGLLVEAMRHVKADIPLLIAGTGPDEARLRKLAQGDPRIRFLGFVADDDLPGLYADALAVPFIPYDEDYGLVTIEAMFSGKPVLTVSDSGGPVEFVRDGETGFVVPPDPKALAERIDHFAAHRDEARKMGETARERVRSIDWASVASVLLGETAPRQRPASAARRPKLTVATTFPIWPPMGGGQSRVFHLYKNLARRYDVDIVTLGQGGGGTGEKEIAPGLVEIRIERSERHLACEQALMDRVGGTPVGDIAAHLLTVFTPGFRDALGASCMDSSAVIACHPYLVDDIKAVAGAKPFWYEAQDVEFDLKRAVLAGQAEAGPLLDIVSKVEARCWREAVHVFACAARDLDRLAELHGPTRAALHEVPNGVALDEIPFTDPSRRRALQERSGLASMPTAIFIGSWHGPNLEAVDDIIAVAPRLPEVRFVVIGSACQPFRDRRLPGNVSLLGQVEAATRDALLAAADVALNPMRTGSGTNLKMLDYFAAGIPVISTTFGARGLKAEAGVHYFAAAEGLEPGLSAFLRSDRECIAVKVAQARKLVEAHYSWHSIANRFGDALEEAGVGIVAPPAWRRSARR